MTPLWNPAKVAEILGVSVKTLASWRCQGKGPKYVKYGGRFGGYRPEAVEEFIRASEVETRN